MSLLDMIGDAEGTPAANYLRGGRTVVKISRAIFRESTPKLPRNSFRIDGEILGSTNPDIAAQVGMQGTMNLNFKFADQDLAKMRRALAAAATSKGIGSGPGGECSEAEASKRSKELIGAEQPLVGALVTVVAVEKPQKQAKDKVFTHYEVEVPNETDLANIQFSEDEAA